MIEMFSLRRIADRQSNQTIPNRLYAYAILISSFDSLSGVLRRGTHHEG